LGFSRRISEAISLVKHHRRMASRVTDHLCAMDASRAAIECALGAPVSGLDILEIGPGQQLKQALYFAIENRVTAIDLDEIVVGWDFGALLRTLKANGLIRFEKTIARKLLGVDEQFAREIARQRGRGTPKVLRRDAVTTGLPDACFDCIVSYSVFEHLPDPAAVMREITRLLRPGGVAHHLVHPYTSNSGAHDARSYVDGALPYWCHLRSDVKHLSAPNCYVNELSLARWDELFADIWPSADVEHFMACRPDIFAALEALRPLNVLRGYTEHELLVEAVQVTWRKPAKEGR
jgi:SAM-dependent methyltransferase